MALRSDWLPALAAFEAAARHQNFAHAAEELHLTASAVSHHVRRLESRLGVPLFQRHARGVALTAEGRQLADTAGSALADMEDVLRNLRADRGADPVVRIATLHSWTCGWLLPRLHDFATRHPEIRISIETGFALARFDDSGPDLGIRHGPGHWPGLTAQLLLDEDMFPVASPRMPGVARVRDAADIARLPLVADTARQGWPDWFRAAGVRGAHVAERYRFSDSNAALTAAANGLGVALAREHIVPPFLGDGRLVALPGPRMRSRWSYYVIHPSHRRLRPAAKVFVDWLLSTAGA
ncbi:MAG TPA: LysR substrate-binding domain-containing protein [Lysobacter sp.]|nr:LysR substrate-binding domain-containing protein [Lysobacter sp.]